MFVAFKCCMNFMYELVLIWSIRCCVMKMSQQWMYDDRCSPQFVEGVHTFLLAAEEKTSGRMVLCLVHVLAVRMVTITLRQEPFTSTCLSPVSCPTIMFGPSTEKEGL